MTLRKEHGKDLYRYSNHRQFLSGFVERSKTADRRFTVSRFAKDLRLKDPASINKILRGQRLPGGRITSQICAYFELDALASRYFHDLVELERADKDPARKAAVLARLATTSPAKTFRLLDLDEFESMSRWHFFAIREMALMADFAPTSEWIGEKLGFKLTNADIKEALRILQKVGLLKLDDDGKLRQGEGSYQTMTEVASEAIKRFHEGAIALAKESIRRVAVPRRAIVGSTLCVRSDKIAEAKQLIVQFQDQMARLLETPGGDAVYQLNVQLFPLTT